MRLKIFRRIILGFSVLLFTGSVTTAMYGAKFNFVGENIYTLKVTFGAGSLTSTAEIEVAARKRLDEATIKHIDNNSKHHSYKVVNYKKYVSNVVYTVEFFPEPL